MTTDSVERFERSLDELGAIADRTTAEEATARIAAAVEEPAIGCPLGIDGVSLPESIETNPTPADLEAARTGVTPARFAVAEYGTLALESTPEGIEPVSLYPDRHVAVVPESDVVEDLGSAFDLLGGRFGYDLDSLVFATGRSATADMGEMVHGVHGPGEVRVVVVTDR